jgi:N-glycosylase/DNA lyase
MTAAVLAETLNGGQAFRWYPILPGANPDPVSRPRAEHAAHSPSAAKTVPAASSPVFPATIPVETVAPVWNGAWGNHAVQLRLNGAQAVEWTAPAARAPATAAALRTYFAGERDFAALADGLPWRSDPHLATCLAAFPGLRILRQPFGETLLGFLCSATKQIVQIKQMLALLAARHGSPLSGLPPTPPQVQTQNFTVETPFQRRLPTWPELAAVPEAELRACLLGFRARYIAETARFLANNPGWLEETETLPYPIAKERLCSLPGVGEKVADCVLLFGAGRLEAFPVDTWILKTLARRYGLEGWKPAQLAHFGRVHFGPLAGLAQQYLFAYERAHRAATPPPGAT